MNNETKPLKKKKEKCCKCKKKLCLMQCTNCKQLICITHFAPNLHDCNQMIIKLKLKQDADPKQELKKQLQAVIAPKIEKI